MTDLTPTPEPTPQLASEAKPDQAPAARPDQAPAAIPQSTPAPRIRSRRRGRALGIVAAIAILALSGLSAYLIVVANSWSERADELEAISTDLGKQVAQSQADAQTARAARDDALAQLEELKGKSTDIVNQAAQAKDRESVLLNYLDSMATCAQQRQEIIDVLTDSRYYFPNKTPGQVEREVTQFCDELSKSVEDLKAEINQ